MNVGPLPSNVRITRGWVFVKTHPHYVRSLPNAPFPLAIRPVAPAVNATGSRFLPLFILFLTSFDLPKKLEYFKIEQIHNHNHRSHRSHY
jgi:hypothetical protein